MGYISLVKTSTRAAIFNLYIDVSVVKVCEYAHKLLPANEKNMIFFIVPCKAI